MKYIIKVQLIDNKGFYMSDRRQKQLVMILPQMETKVSQSGRGAGPSSADSCAYSAPSSSPRPATSAAALSISCPSAVPSSATRRLPRPLPRPQSRSAGRGLQPEVTHSTVSVKVHGIYAMTVSVRVLLCSCVRHVEGAPGARHEPHQVRHAALPGHAPRPALGLVPGLVLGETVTGLPPPGEKCCAVELETEVNRRFAPSKCL